MSIKTIKHLLLFVMLICAKPLSAEQAALKAISSLYPLASLLAQVGGNYIEVEVLAGSARDPHNMELRPSDLKSLSQSQLVFLNGLQLEFWADQLELDLSGRILRLSDILKTSSGDPHLWLDPAAVTLALEPITERLCSLRAEACPAFKKNAAILREDLESLNSSLLLEIKPWRSKSFVAYHSAWSRFAQRYGLKQVAVLSSSGHSDEIRASQIVSMIRSAQQANVHVLILDPYSSETQIEALLEQAGFTKVVLDELGKPFETYQDFIRRNVASLSAVLK